ncbi:hypothetical protein BGX23_001134 [Mortierella sp. AD031]|nr:hypothetical protein BGX23_001134 [Mortierella sp. AD031]
MTTGGYLTRKLYVPRQAWYQKGGGGGGGGGVGAAGGGNANVTTVRLPAAEAKISACHTIILLLEQMVAQSRRGMLNLLIGPSTAASLTAGSGSSSGSGSTSSCSSSFISPYSPASPITTSMLSFQSTSSSSTTSAIAAAVAAVALAPATASSYSLPPTPTTPTQASISGAPTVGKNNRNSTIGTGPYSAIDAEQDRILLTKELEALESAVLQIWSKLSKKLSFVHRPGKYFGNGSGSNGIGNASSNIGTNSRSQYQSHHHHHQAQDLQQSFQDHEYQDDNNHHSHNHSHYHSIGTDFKTQWKHFSKSVQKSMAHDKVEDTTAYTESVLRLFQSAAILETMFRHYTALSATTAPSSSSSSSSAHQTYHQIIYRLRRLGDFLNLVICAFVVRDLGEFLAKYTKRVSAWTNE